MAEASGVPRLPWKESGLGVPAELCVCRNPGLEQQVSVGWEREHSQKSVHEGSPGLWALAGRGTGDCHLVTTAGQHSGSALQNCALPQLSALSHSQCTEQSLSPHTAPAWELRLAEEGVSLASEALPRPA